MRAVTRRHVAQQEVKRLEGVVARRSAKLDSPRFVGDEVYRDRLTGRVIRSRNLLAAARDRLAALPQPEEERP